ncbi:atypical chemokine receptor 3a [Salminus brasiliensis]|uniref:atypical chemokine receptor 3a n=1 Tax=Salminus brasiliensis TaxID=930266 RepID=UPI003B82EDC8
MQTSSISTTTGGFSCTLEFEQVSSSPLNEKMSFSASDLSDLFTMWEKLNLTHHDSNMSQVETQICHTSFSRSALLKTVCTIYIFCFVVGVAANTLVLWVNLRSRRRERHEMHVYILNLAMADLCVVATLPIWASSLAQDGHWPFGQVACKLTHLTFSVSLFASIFFLACMSVDRYLTAVRTGETSRQWERPSRRIVCAGVWLIALIASVPDTYFLQSVKSLHGNVTLCHPVYPQNNPMEWMVGAELSFVVLGFAVPFPVIATSYARLVSASAPSNCNQGRSVSKKTIVTYIVVFLACWVPYHAVLLADALALLGVLSLSCREENGLFIALNLTQCLSMLHCCLNPLVYTFARRHYRYDFMKAFIFKYSTRTGLARLMEGSQGTEIEYAALENQLQL